MYVLLKMVRDGIPSILSVGMALGQNTIRGNRVIISRMIKSMIINGLGLSRCLGPGECLHSFINGLQGRITPR